MPHQDKPEPSQYLLLILIFILWGLAGGLDRPFDDPESAATSNCLKQFGTPASGRLPTAASEKTGGAK